MIQFVLSCWTCRKRQDIQGERKTQWSGDLLAAVEAAGWKSLIDSIHGRMLVFCSEECAKKAMTKHGGIRLHRPRPS